MRRSSFFFFNDTATTEIYTLSLHDALPICLFRALDPLKTPPHPIELLVHGTTIATNALLERRGARVALVTTKGFEDLLWLRRQDRAALYDLARDHSPPLVARSDVVAVAERTGPEGVLEPLGEIGRAHV